MNGTRGREEEFETWLVVPGHSELLYGAMSVECITNSALAGTVVVKCIPPLQTIRNFQCNAM